MTETQTKKIGDICDVVKGATGIMKAIPGEYPMPTLAEERNSHNEYQFDCKAVIVPLVSSTGHGHASIKRVHYQEGKFALGTILAAVIPRDEKYLHPKYLYIYLSYFKDELLVPLMSGAANVTLSIKSINSIEIIIPPYKKQLGIIKLEEVLSRQKKSIETKLSDQKIILQKLRQAILQDAISGKLTVDWRKKNPNIEPASELLKKIKAEKEKLIAEKKIKKEKPLPKIDEKEIPFDLPNGWVWTRLGKIVQHNSGKTLDAGRNAGKLREYITTSNLYWGRFDIDNLKTMPINDEELDKCTATRGDLLVCEGGEAGRAAVWENDRDVCFQNHIHRIRPYCKIDSYYIFRYFLKISCTGEINLYRKGMGITNMSGKSLSLIVFPLPPLFEQKVIVEKVEILMQKLDRLETEISQNQKTADQLMQAVLKEAFEE